MTTDPCPPDQHLSDFLFGRIDELSADEVGAHVQGCVECQATLNECNGQQDTIVATLKHGIGQPKFDCEPELQRALDQVGAMQTSHVSRQADSVDSVTPKLMSPGGVRLGQYQLLELLGEGGMGTVYKAEHTRLEMIVAVKVLSELLTNDSQAVARFDGEMKAVGKVNHPNIVRATDAGEQDGRHYLAMEFVDGRDLNQLVQAHGRLRINDACEAIRQAALGIEHSHHLGLIHRDLKPSNLMVSRDGQVKVLDLGLARLLNPKADRGGLTNDFQVMGTADYMPPEQALSATTVDHRVDIYSLGCTLYTLLCGSPPFSGPEYDEPLKKLMGHDRDMPTSVIRRRPEVPGKLSSLIDRALAKLPTDRLSTAAEFATALQPFAAGADLALLVSKANTPETQRDTHDMSNLISVTDTAMSAVRPKTIAKRTATRRRYWPVVATLLLLSGALAATIVFHSSHGKGTLVVEIEGDRIAGEIVGGSLLIEDKRSGAAYRLTLRGASVSRPLQTGDYTIEVVNAKAGLHLLTTEFTIVRDKRAVVRAYIEQPLAAVPVSLDRSVAEWSLRKNAIVTWHQSNESKIVTRVEDLPENAFVIGKIDFAQPCQFTDDELAELAGLTTLRDLAFQDPQLTSRIVDHLALSPNLSLVELRFDTISPNGLHLLADLPRVQTLQFYGAMVEDDDVEVASQLGQLLWLGLRGPCITDTSLAHVGTMRQLKLLHLLSAPRISDEGISHICNLPNLTELFAIDTAITDEGMRQLVGLKQLDWLNLSRTQISDDGLKHVAEMVWLKRFTATRTRLTNTGVANLRPLVNLFHLDLANTQINDRAVDDLAVLPCMTDLRVGTQLSTEAIEELRTRMPNCKVGP